MNAKPQADKEDPFVLLLKDEGLPLEREIFKTINKKKQTLNIPLTVNSSSIVYFISQKQKSQLQEAIHKFLKFITLAEFAEGELSETKIFPKNQNQQNISYITYLPKFLPSFAFGSNPLKNFEQNHHFQQLKSSQSTENPEEKQEIKPDQQQEKQFYKLRYNAAILIYDGCSLDQLKENIKQFQDFKVLVFINGRQKFKQFISSLEDLDKKQKFFDDFNKFAEDYFTSSSHVQFYNLNWNREQNKEESQYSEFFKNVFHLVIAPEKFDYPILIKWIYQGLLKYIDPKFAFVGSTNMKFEDNIGKSLIEKFGEKSNSKLVGLQWKEEHQQKNTSNFNFWSKPDFGINYFLMDSNFTIKKFHNPLSCFYDWEKMSYVLDEFVGQVSQNVKFSGINEILPSLLYQNDQQYIGYTVDIISTTYFSDISQEELFQRYCLRNYDIQEQLYRGIQISRSNITFCKFISFSLQNYLCKIIFFESYFGLAICLFFSFQCPYQLINYILDSSVGYTALAILIPTFSGLNILLIVILSSLYSVLDRFNKINNSEFFYFKINQNTITKYDSLQGTYDTQEIEQKEDVKLILIKLYDEKDLENKDKELSIKLGEEKIEYYAQLNQKFQMINTVFTYLLQNQSALDFTIAISVLGNVIISYGSQFMELDSIYRLIVIIFAIVCLIFIIIPKRKKIFNEVFNLSLISFISYIYISLQKIGNPEQQIVNKRNTAKLLILNCLLFYVFICIESYYEYSGYILLGILGSLSLIELFKCIMILLGNRNTLLSSKFTPEQQTETSFNLGFKDEEKILIKYFESIEKLQQKNIEQLKTEIENKKEIEKYWQQDKITIKQLYQEKFLCSKKLVSESHQ